jgi:hypothetical protein
LQLDTSGKTAQQPTLEGINILLDAAAVSRDRAAPPIAFFAVAL